MVFYFSITNLQRMKNVIRNSNIFTQHPNSVGESYFQHFGKSFSFCLLLLSLSFKAMVHAIFPFCYKTSVSDRILDLSDTMRERNTISK